MGANDLENLKTLLLAEERAELDEIKSKVQALSPAGQAVAAHAVANVLAESVERSHEQGASLSEAFRAPVVESLRLVATQDRETLANVLFPAMLPAIRKAIAASIKAHSQSMGRVLERSASPAALRWRFEAWRTNVPFSEVVMRHTLKYEVEEVLLIHRRSGLLIGHVTSSTGARADPHAVSALFTAIQDYAHDTFGSDADSELDDFDVGDREVKLCRDKVLTLACVVRGVDPPMDVIDEFRMTLADIRSSYGRTIEQFDGDASTLVGLDARLRRCLHEGTADSESRQGDAKHAG